MPFYELAVPIFSGRLLNKEFEIVDNYGTAFAIAPNIFVTANHAVADPSEKDQQLAFVYEDGGIGKVTGIKKIDRFPDIDIAIVETYYPIPDLVMYKWLNGMADMITDIITVGYGYSVLAVNNRKLMSQRAFKGYIISIVRYCDLPREISAYELSFRVPKGQSGASVFVRDLYTDIPHKSIIGVVIRNTIESITYGDSENTVKEITREGKNIETVTTVEASQFAIVVPTTEILPLHSEILGKTVREYLQEKDLLVTRPVT